MQATQDIISYSAVGDCLRAQFSIDVTGADKGLVESGIIGSWAVLLAKSFETRQPSYTVFSGDSSSRLSVAIEGAWTVPRLRSAVQEQLSRAVSPKADVGIDNESRLTSAISVNQRSAISLTTGFQCFVNCTLTTSCSLDVTVDTDASVDDKTARRLSSRFSLLSRQILHGGPDQTVAELDIFSHEDWNQIIELNGDCSPAVNECVHSLFKKQVRVRPSATAVESWDGSFTYRELDILSSRLARALSAKLSPETESIVALCFEKSKWSVVSMLAVFKSGAAYVPLDPAYPVQRIDSILETVKAQIILTSKPQKPLFEARGTALDVIPVDAELFEILPNPSRGDTFARAVNPSSPSCVLFTSGSTGKPKGVVLTHSSLATSMLAHGPAIGMGPSTRTLQFASLVFDASLFEIFSTLTFGGCTCIITEKDRLNNLEASINGLRVNLAFLTTTMAGLLDPATVPTLQNLCVGGEPVTVDVVRSWSSRNLMLMYGPSECTIYSTMCASVDKITNPANLGRAIGCSTWIVDPEDHDRLAPIGVPGEIVIQGGILARGYLHDREKTAAAWINSPEWRAGGSPLSTRDVPTRVYKSGDIGRYDTDGSILYCNRKDTQTKLRGQRMELGEIEYHLTNHSNVHQTAIFHPKTGPAKHRIVAVVRFTDKHDAPSSAASDSGLGSDLSASEESSADGNHIPVISEQGSEEFWTTVKTFEEHLQALLPQFMVPNVWIGVPKLPTTISGKVDRVGLQRWIEDLDDEIYHKLVRSEPTIEAPVQPAGNGSDSKIQLKIRGIWSDVLNFPAERIPFEASFFQLGGDSISAMQVAARCAQSGLQVSVQQILQSRTIARLADTINSEASSLVGPHNVLIDTVEVGKPFDLSPIQTMMFKLQPNGENHHNQGFLCRLTRPIEPSLIVKSLAAIVEAHPMLRARFRKFDGKWMQLITDEVEESFIFAEHTGNGLVDVDRICASRQTVFNVDKGPMISADLITLGGQNQKILFLNAHHVVMDLVSWRIILQDLEDLLNTRGEFELARSTSFQAWSKLQVENSRRVKLADTIPFQLPEKMIDYSYWGLDCKNIWGDNREVNFFISPKLTDMFLRDATEPLQTAPMDILLAALSSSFLSVFADRDQLLVHAEGHGREPWDNSVDLSRTVGWFTTIYPLLFNRQSDPLRLLFETKSIREKTPSNGRPYFAALHHSEEQIEKERRNGGEYLSPVELLFNYQGAYQQLHREKALLQRVTELDIEPGMNAPSLHRYALFEIEAAIEGDRLGVHVIYNQHIKRTAEVLEWVKTWEEHLVHLLEDLTALHREQSIWDYSNPAIGLELRDKSYVSGVIAPKLGYPAVIEGVYPCSPPQQAILAKRTVDTNYHSSRMAWELSSSSALDVSRICAAWQTLVDREQMLRTVIIPDPARSGRFLQVVLESYTAKISTSTIPHGADSVEEVLSRQPREIFDCTQPRHKFSVVQKANRVFCQLEIDRTIADAQSVKVLLDEFKSAYSGQPLGEGVPFSKYVEYMQTASRTAGKDFWTAKLEGTRPTMFPLSAEDVDGKENEVLAHRNPAIGSVSAVREFCATNGCGFEAFVYTVWAATLRWFTGNDSVSFGTTTSGRKVDLAEVKNIVGPLENVSIYSTTISGDSSVADALDLAEAFVTDRAEFESTPLGKIQEWLGAEEKPLFNTIISIIESTVQETSSISATEIVSEEPTDYDIVLRVDKTEEIRIDLAYWSSRISTQTMDAVANTFTAVAIAILEDKHRVVDTISRDKEASSELVNQIDTPLPENLFGYSRVHDIILSFAEKHPDNIAIEAQDGTITYGNLLNQVSRLVGKLISLGVGHGHLVGVSSERSEWMVISCLAILSVGAGYADLSKRGCKAFIAPSAGAGSEWAVLKNTAFEKRHSRILEEGCLAVVSEPNGVQTVITHSQVIGTAVAAYSSLSFDASTRCLQYHPNSSVFHVVEIFHSLMFGGGIIMPPSDIRVSELECFIAVKGASIAFLPPSVASQISPAKAPSLQTLVLVDEPALPNEAAVWMDNVSLWQTFGSLGIESVAFCSRLRHAHSRPALKAASSSHSGRVWVAELYNSAIPAPAGVIGELIHSSLTGFSFATGVLARSTNNGLIEYVGSKSVRSEISSGHAVDIFSIERALHAEGETSPLRAQIVTPLTGENMLAAFLTDKTASEDGLVSLDRETQERLRGLRSRLSAHLPKSMVPAMFILMGKLPAAANGTTDRAALDEIVANLTAEQVEMYCIEPSATQTTTLTENERKLAMMWCTTLGADFEKITIGREDSFFKLGADNFDALKLVSVCRKEGWELDVQTILSNPKLKDMAGWAIKNAPSVSFDKPPAPFSLLGDQNAVDNAKNILSTKYGYVVEAIEDIYPCAPLQEALIALSILHPGSYTAQHVYEVPMNLNAERFRNAWVAVINAHPLLRTQFVLGESSAIIQVVLRRQSIDWETDPAADRPKLTFEYDKPLCRYELFNLGTPKARFVWSIHHSLADGWAFELVTTDVATAYRYGEGMILKTPRTPYTSFIQYLQNINTKESLDFWKKKLDGFVRSDFPASKMGATTPSTKKMVRNVRVSTGASGFTAATLLNGAWALLLSRLSNSDDVCFGTPVTGRMVPIPGIETMVGPTIQTLPTRVTIDTSLPVTSYLADIEESYIETIPHEHIGFQNINKLSDAAKDACAFKTMLVVQPLPAEELVTEDGNILMRKLEALLDVDYPMTMNCWQRHDAVKMEMCYDASQVEDSVASRTLAQFETLLGDFMEALKQETSRTVGELSSLSAEDIRQMHAWNYNFHGEEERLKYGDETTVPERIEKNIRLQPDALAADGWDGKLTYAELGALSTRLAHHLVKKGVKPEVLVPVVFDKSIWFLVAVVAVWKAGAAYVPLDAGQPAERLAQIVDAVSSHATVALASPERSEFTRNFTGLETILVDRAPIMALQLPTSPPALPAIRQNTASYVIFTSGSTGKPKGVLVEHGPLFVSLREQARVIRCGPHERVFAFCSYIWDVHLLENFMTLFAGGCVCVPTEQERTDRLAEAMAKYKVTRGHMSPAVAALLNPKEIPSLRTLCVGGDVMAKKTIERFSGIYLCNAYGPTEAVITSNMFCGLDADTNPKNIGAPLGSHCWIVDANDHEKLLPIGSVGELVFSGPCLARGYLDRKKETDAVFINQPNWAGKFSSGKINRIYKSGDLAKWSDDGTMEFYGRKDAQVKINGIRIELGEIEQNITAVSGYDCAVEVSQAGTNSKVLAGFITFPAGKDFDGVKAALDGELKNRLPRYMVPTLWVPLPRLPQQSNTNKLDRKALRSFFNGLTKQEMNTFSCTIGNETRAIVPPENDMERTVQSLWCTVFEMESHEIGRDDHFFRMQGDSIMAIRMVSEARRMGFHITTKDIFQHPVLREMAGKLAVIEANTSEEAIAPFSLIPEELVPQVVDDAAAQIEGPKEQIENIMPCTPMQEGLIAASFSERGSYFVNHMNQLPADIDIERFKAAWDIVVAANPILRSRIIQSPIFNDEFLQVTLKTMPIKWDMVDPARWEDYWKEVTTIKVISGSPLWRFGICEDKFLFTVHHSLYDAGSLPNVFQHFREAYGGQQLTTRTSYSHFIRYLKTVHKGQSEAVWKRELDCASGTSFPQTDLNKGTETPDPRFFDRLIKVPDSGKSVYTLSTMLRAAWGLVLTRHTKKEDICFRETLSGKNAPVAGIDNIAGPTICSVPFRIQIEDDMTVGTYLENVNAYATRIMGHEHYGVQNISRVSLDAQAACQFGALLVIQPSEDTDGSLGFGIRKIASPMNQNIPLILEFTLRANGIVKLTARYDTHILREDRVSCILGHIENALSGLMKAKVSKPLKEVSLFGGYDEQWLQTLTNPTPPPGDLTIWDFVDKFAKETPDSEVVCAWDGSFTWNEFEHAVSTLASHLVDAGIGSDAPIGLCFPKSRWVIVFMFAALKAGSSYVSLDPKSPPARISLILESCKPSIIFTLAESKGLFSGMPWRIHTISFDDMPAFGRTLIVNHPESRIKLGNTAYIIYTSGSTGTPKGVVITNQALVDTSRALAASSTFTNQTRTFQFSAFTWDAAVYEIYSPLVVGGCVCLPSEDERVGDFAGAINRMQANADLLMPSVAALLEPEDVPTLHTLLLGGEAVNRNDVARWTDAGRDVRMAYGPTEACVVALMNNKIPEGGIRGNPANLGDPVPGQASAWIVDLSTGSRLAGVGEIGELVLSSHNLSTGYLNDQEKTDKAFFHASWLEGRSTSRCYRTGDLAQYEADGSILFCGRKDNQIKLRGLRIELGEIESHLVQDPLLARGAVIFPSKGRYKKTIVAVFSLVKNAEGGAIGPETQAIREDCAAEVDIMRTNMANKVPSYMVPTTWLALRKVPVTPIGKIDRRQITAWVENLEKVEEELPAVAEAGAVGEDPFKEDSPMRKALRKVWAEVLAIHPFKISADASFFKLGGDSITAIRMVSRCRRENIAITSKQIKRLKTIAALENAVTLIDESAPINAATTPVSNAPFALTPIQKMHFELMPEGCNSFSQATLLRVDSSRLTIQQLAHSLKKLAMHHSMLRARFFRDSEGDWVQQLVETPDKSFTLTVRHGPNLESFREDAVLAQGGFDLDKGHTLNACIFNTDDGKQYIYLAAHHLVVDFVSWKILITDLESLIHSGDRSELMLSPASYQNWAEKVQEHAKNVPAPANSGDDGAEALGFWGFESAAAVTYGSRAEVPFELTKDDTDNIAKFAYACETDILTVLIATLVSSFWKIFPDRAQLDLFLENHGRDVWTDRIDLSRTVGWFTTFYPLLSTSKQFKKKQLTDVVEYFKGAKDEVTDAHAYLCGKLLSSEKTAPLQLEIILNHFGNVDTALQADKGLFQLETKADFTVIPPDMARVALFEVNTSVMDGKLNASFSYDNEAEHQERIKAWASNWQRTLKNLGSAPAAPKLIATNRKVPETYKFKLLPRSAEDMNALMNSTLPSVGLNPADIEDIYPCSGLQTGMAIGQMKNPAAYNIEIIWEVRSNKGRVDTSRLEKAWKQTIKRHAMLRTVFIEDSTGVDPILQVVLKPEAEMPLPGAGPPVALGGKLAYRFAVYHDEPVKIKFECSHAIFDSWSNGVFLRDLEAAYGDKLTTKKAPGFGLFIDHMRNKHSDIEGQKFWSSYLQDAEVCHFPNITTNPKEGLAATSWKIDDPDNRITDFCAAHDTTGAVFFKLMWSLVLRLYTGNNVTAFGSLLDGRDPDFDGIEDIVGPIINTVVCKATLPGDKRVVDALMELQEAAEDSVDHQRCSLAQVETWAGFAGIHMFNTVTSFYMDSVHSGKLDDSAELTFKHIEGSDKTEYPIILKVMRRKNEFNVQIDYHTDCIEQAQVDEVRLHMQTMIDRLISNPEITVEDLQRQTSSQVANTEQHCCFVISRNDNQILPLGCRGELVIKNPMGGAPFPTGQLARYDTDRNVIDVRPSDEIYRVRGFDLDLAIVEGAFSASATNKICQFIAVPTGISACPLAQAKIALYVCFSTNAPAACTWNEIASSLRSSAKSSLPQYYQHVVAFENLIPIGGVVETLTRQSVLNLITGRLIDKTLSIGFAQDVEPEETATEVNEVLKSEPANETEQALKQLFAQVLSVSEDKINKKTNFFEVGGDSLTAMQLVQRARKLSIKLTHGEILRFPILENMAQQAKKIEKPMLDTARTSEAASNSIAPRPFSLVKSPVTASALKTVHPVEDAYPANFFQRWSIPQSMSETRNCLAHFNYDIDGALDFPRISEACRIFVRRNETLRTAFIVDETSNEFLQVVLRDDFVPEVTRTGGVENIEEYTHRYIAAEGALRNWGEPIVRFKVLSDTAGFRHRLIMRITHAQFDGLSMFPLVEELRYAYNLAKTGATTEALQHNRRPKMSAFVQATQKLNNPSTRAFWGNLLRGTNGLTPVLSAQPKGPRDVQTAYRSARVTNDSFRSHNATFSTALKAAWAVVLSNYVRSEDVVFANLVSARTAPVPEADRILGCCINIVPVRVSVSKDASTRTLLSTLQDQHAATMPLEAMDYEAICSAAGWSNKRLTTIVQHQNMKEVGNGIPMGDDGEVWRFHQLQPRGNDFDVWVISWAKEEGKMEIGIGHDRNRISEEMANKLCKAVCQVLEGMAEQRVTACPSAFLS